MSNSLFRILVISFSLFFYCTAALFSENNELVREIIAHNNDSVFRYTYYFDNFKNKVVENKYYINENQVSIPLLRIEWVYEANNCVLQRQQKWLNGSWDTFYLIESTYSNNATLDEKFISVINNVNHLEKTILYHYAGDQLQSISTYRGSESAQQLAKTDSYMYDASHRLQNIQIECLSQFGTSIKQIFHYSYNTAGKLDSLIYSNYEAGELVGKQLTLFSYDDLNQLISQTLKNHIVLTSKWEHQTKSEYYYSTSGKLIQEIYSNFGGAFWLPNLKYEYIYDRQDLLQSKIMYQTIYRQWRKLNTIEYSQIENNQPNLMESNYNFWGGNTGEYVNNFIPYYFNNEISIMEANRMELRYTIDPTIVTDASFETRWLKIYPNPSNGVFYINTQNYYIDSWEVYDLHGMKVKAATNHFRTGIIDLTEFPDGMYMIKALTNDNKQLKQKIIIQRNQ